ncbi:MAG TPA: hypothetical protein VNO22_00190 [Planctomycetota bacterium]|nr:hypothetical protein [Planctomycetota bacterium]
MAANLEDTTLGGTRRDFPETQGDFLARVRDASDDVRRAGLEELARRYWKPIYYYFRLGWAKTNEDAKDLTQAFLAWLVEDDALRRYEAERASFRTYLKTLLKRFAQHEEEARGRLKRGGGVRLVSLDDEALDRTPPVDPGDDPERRFDREWLRTLTERAVGAVRRQFEANGRALAFRAFEEYDLVNPARRPTYAEVAARLGVKESDVRNHLFAVREEVRAALRRELAELTRDAAELEEEWKALLGS